MKRLVDIVANKEELRKIWNSNSKLKEKVESCYIEVEEICLEDVLDCFKDSLEYYSIDICNGCNYFKINDTVSFLNDIIEATEYYGLLNEEDEKKANKLLEKIEVIEELEDEESYEKIEVLEIEIEEGVNELLTSIEKYFDISSELFNDDYMFSYFYENYIDIMIYNKEESFVYDEDYILYEKKLESYK